MALFCPQSRWLPRGVTGAACPLTSSLGAGEESAALPFRSRQSPHRCPGPARAAGGASSMCDPLRCGCDARRCLGRRRLRVGPGATNRARAAPEGGDGRGAAPGGARGGGGAVSAWAWRGVAASSFVCARGRAGQAALFLPPSLPTRRPREEPGFGGSGPTARPAPWGPLVVPPSVHQPPRCGWKFPAGGWGRGVSGRVTAVVRSFLL